MATAEQRTHTDGCDCGRCIRVRVWSVFLRVEAELRAELAAERAALGVPLDAPGGTR